jgi:hypothetical protein
MIVCMGVATELPTVNGGSTERQVRRIENGEGMTFQSLRRLAAAHGLDLKKYLDEVTKMIEKSDRS